MSVVSCRPLVLTALTCTNDVSLSVLQNDIWQNANTELPVMGMYYLNGKYYGHSMCDVVTCQKIENSYDINLVEYQKVGEKESPYPNNESGLKPIFKQVPLDGRIKVLINFYSDEKCTQKTSFEKVIDENKS